MTLIDVLTVGIQSIFFCILNLVIFAVLMNLTKDKTDD